jgi:L-ascorbate metabolism protein UlaG (beta-lactamase superfamily)
VAWLIKVDGLTIYHNGDCQPAEPGPENDFLKTKASSIDLAFVFPILDSEKYGVQTRDLFKKLAPKAVFPMHVTAGSDMYLGFEKAGRALSPALPISVPMKMGQRFVFRGGSIV